MPWTLAHPAITLPLHRLSGARLPLAGLIAGSMAPDFSYYLGLFQLASFAHTGPGLLVFCLPAALLMTWLVCRWRLLLTAPLPQLHQAAINCLQPPPFDSIQAWVRLCLAILLGSASHLFWDAFTHTSGFAVNHLEVLRIKIGVVSGRSFFVYNLAQHLSTALGCIFLFFAYKKWLSQQQVFIAVSARNAYPALVMCLMFSLLIAVLVSTTVLAPAISFSATVVRGVMLSTLFFALSYLALAMVIVRKNG